MSNYNVYLNDCIDGLRQMQPESVNTCVTSPPYFGLRDYGVDGQIGLEDTPDEYVNRLVEVFREVRRVLRDDGTVWLNLGDSYSGSWGNYGGQNRGNGKQREIVNGSNAPSKAYVGTERLKPPTANKVDGLKPKDLIGIPWAVAFALRADGWYLRQDIIWHKPNPMPESVKDRCTNAHEYVFLLSKSKKYFYDADAIAEKSAPWGLKNRDNNKSHSGGTGLSPHRGLTGKHDGSKGRNKRSVWTIPTRPFPDAHFAVFPPQLILPCVLAGCPEGGTVLDPFTGSGTTGMVALEQGRDFVGCELNPDYHAMATARLAGTQSLVNLEWQVMTDSNAYDNMPLFAGV